MGWQEKIEQHKARQQREEEKKDATEKAERLKVAKEKIPPLLEALNQFPIREFLEQIRSEEWKLGKIYITSDEISPESPIKAEIKLVAEWPDLYRAQWGSKGSEEYGPDSRYLYRPEGVRIHSESLGVEAWWIGYQGYPQPTEGGVRLYGFSKGDRVDFHLVIGDFGDINLGLKIEDFLIEASINRREKYAPPYDQRKAEAEMGVIEAILRGEPYSLGPEYKYLLARAKKA